MHIEILKLLNKKYGDSRFFQCIVRDYLECKTREKDKVVIALSVMNK